MLDGNVIQMYEYNSYVMFCMRYNAECVCIAGDINTYVFPEAIHGTPHHCINLLNMKTMRPRTIYLLMLNITIR